MRRCKRSVCLTLVIVSMASVAFGDIQIIGLSDIDFGLITPGGNTVVASDSFCVYTNAPSQESQYEVEACGAGSGGDYDLQDSHANKLPYSVSWSDGSKSRKLSCGKFIKSFALSALPQCGGGNNVTLELEIKQNDFKLSSVVAGSYGGSLFLTVMPR
ncbi:MAG: hypothetical protein COV52_07520 [Gammaproteobacteria bacterium CG11_big_fil_rev_8_21_14_0_20_46_22]|nr:MAG: hypothetical protein COW05_06760 [Gammaproteobacteria bacterium CG12_big_fil_rev_8_21_14_0_65_46_12]PIR10731.1 MAG: hypothetical protein COV52_07520 [Gammaproteobacteria bacterium CG11_big_fil_rev_8_21_14_0_20_46_22]